MLYSNIHKYSHEQPKERGFYNIEGSARYLSPDSWDVISEAPPNDLWLNSLVYLSKAFDSRDVDEAYRVYKIWKEKSPRVEPRSSKPASFCWNEIAVTSRLFVLAYLCKFKDCPDLYVDLLDHLNWLVDDRNYIERHNHGQYQDAAIVKFFCDYDGSFDVSASGYVEKVLGRFVDSVSHCVSDMGVHLEHSSAYHFTMIKMINSFLFYSPNKPLKDIEIKMRRVADFYIYPDSTLPQLGDSYRNKGYSLRNKQGLFFDKYAGLAIVRWRHWDIFFTCWHHSAVHKHSDELSFELSKGGERVLIDSGSYGFNYSDPINQYMRSLSAHNALDFPGLKYDARREVPYKSGLLGADESSNGFILYGYNPHIYKRGVLHLRVIEITKGDVFVTDYVKSLLDQNVVSEANFHLDDGVNLKKVTRSEFDIGLKTQKLKIFIGHGSGGIGRYFGDIERKKGIYCPFDRDVKSNHHIVASDTINSEFKVFTTQISSSGVRRLVNSDIDLYKSLDGKCRVDIVEIERNLKRL